MLVGHRAAVNVIDFDRRFIVSASGDRTIKVWDMSTCEFVRTLNGHKRGIACLQYRDSLVVSGSSDNTIRSADLTATVSQKFTVPRSVYRSTIQRSDVSFPEKLLKIVATEGEISSLKFTKFRLAGRLCPDPLGELKHSTRLPSHNKEGLLLLERDTEGPCIETSARWIKEG